MNDSALRGPGRPSKMTPAMVARICEGLATGLPLNIVCKSKWLPSPRTVRRWMASDHQCRREVLLARLSGAERFLWETKLAADDRSNDLIQTAEGIAGNVLAVDRARLEVATRFSLFQCWWPGGPAAIEAKLAKVPPATRSQK